ncbi:2,5-diamino-6-(ribosylamino)-4(3H)-pyrimidinone 5'-phosphate reductase [Polyrhizophydium stewartii]|uniref:2,5-diamino-6-ribosylamino-4(3H)-pyrimidinone 5'-phosphate reductase n=1 Tax=Polyrhizophydium stewartii TaxID=2732419 RepID=A0ABR4N9B3_9FUNG|nr:hypothetical protein HK105_005858 [Polyrhizophydium stewartii]
MSLAAEAYGFLAEHGGLPAHACGDGGDTAASDRPYTTLTFAQTLDGFIALPGRPLSLSAPESMALTHALRASHDAILVGVQTVVCDNPSLTTRFVDEGPPPARISPPPQPRPVILDSSLRCPPTAKVLSRQPLVLTTQTRPDGSDEQTAASWLALEDAGASIVTVPAGAGGRIDIAAALAIIAARHGVRSVMIEGGAQVIRECLSNAQVVIDRLIVTIAPMVLGGGVHCVAGAADPQCVPAMPQLESPRYKQFGRDMVLCARVDKKLLNA